MAPIKAERAGEGGGMNPALGDPDPGYALILAASHLTLTGQAISPWEDPCPIVSHGTEPDPIFRWANPAALALWETDWETFTQMPSRLSAQDDPDIQTDRSRYLAEARARGFVEGYQGIRISAKGRRFRIRATLWTVSGPGGILGQAARICQIERLG
jgi:hypothetical protein